MIGEKETFSSIISVCIVLTVQCTVMLISRGYKNIYFLGPTIGWPQFTQLPLSCFRRSFLASGSLTFGTRQLTLITTTRQEPFRYVLSMVAGVGFEFHYIFYTNSGKETHFRLECPFMPFPLELSEHVFSPKAFHAFFTWTFWVRVFH